MLGIFFKRNPHASWVPLSNAFSVGKARSLQVKLPPNHSPRARSVADYGAAPGKFTQMGLDQAWCPFSRVTFT
jgi:hypothetical protein